MQYEGRILVTIDCY